MLVFLVCGGRENFYVFSFYRNPDFDDRIYDCLLISNGCSTDWGLPASFLFVCYLTGNHQEWMGSTTTNCNGLATFDFVTVSGCDQLADGLTRVVEILELQILQDKS